MSLLQQKGDVRVGERGVGEWREGGGEGREQQQPTTTQIPSRAQTQPFAVVARTFDKWRVTADFTLHGYLEGGSCLDRLDSPFGTVGLR